MIDDSYVTSAKESHNSWEKFLSALGVVHLLAVERKDITLSKSTQVSYILDDILDICVLTVLNNDKPVKPPSIVYILWLYLF